MRRLSRRQWVFLTIGLLVVLWAVMPLPRSYSQSRTLVYILNKVFNPATNTLMGIPWAGAQGTQRTLEAIFNLVYDEGCLCLRMSGEGDGGTPGANTVGSGEVIDNSLAAVDLAPDSVGTSEVIDASIAAIDLAPNSVDASELVATAVTPGTYGTETEVGSFTVDADGRITAASNIVITTTGGGGGPPTGAAGGDATGSTYPNIVIAANAITSTKILDATVTADDLAAGSVGTSEVIDASIAAIDLAPNSVDASELVDTAGTPGAFGSATQVGTFTRDADGRLTAAADVAIAIPLSAITDVDLTTTAPIEGQTVVFNELLELVPGDFPEAQATTGIQTSANEVMSIRYRAIEMTGNNTLGVHAIILYTVGAEGGTLTLPSVADPLSPGWYKIIIVDTGAGYLTLLPFAGDTMNAIIPITGQGMEYIAWRTGVPTSWRIEETTTVAVGDVFTTASNTYTTGTQSFASATAVIDKIAAGYAPTAEGSRGTNSTTHRPVWGRNGVATLTQGGRICSATGTSVNDSGAGAGADFNHAGVQCSIPASSLFAGDWVHLYIAYKLTTGGTGVNLNMALKHSTTTTLALGGSYSVAANINAHWGVLHYVLYVAADPGAAVSVSTFPVVMFVGTRDAFNSSQTTQPVSLATNATLLLTPVSKWSAAGGSDNEFTVLSIHAIVQ